LHEVSNAGLHPRSADPARKVGRNGCVIRRLTCGIHAAAELLLANLRVSREVLGPIKSPAAAAPAQAAALRELRRPQPVHGGPADERAVHR
jgi:hypothetical protein